MRENPDKFFSFTFNTLVLVEEFFEGEGVTGYHMDDCVQPLQDRLLSGSSGAFGVRGSTNRERDLGAAAKRRRGKAPKIAPKVI